MKRMLVFSLLFAVGTSLAAVNFSGEWELDRSKSNLPEGGQGRGPGAFVASKMTVTQDANTLTMERTMPGRDGGERKMTTTTTLDGKVTKTSNERGESEVKAVWENETLVVETHRKFEGPMGSFESTRKEKWTLSADGKTLTIEFTQSTPRGETNGKAVYLKK